MHCSQQSLFGLRRISLQTSAAPKGAKTDSNAGIVRALREPHERIRGSLLTIAQIAQVFPSRTLVIRPFCLARPRFTPELPRNRGQKYRIAGTRKVTPKLRPRHALAANPSRRAIARAHNTIASLCKAAQRWTKPCFHRSLQRACGGRRCSHCLCRCIHRQVLRPHRATMRRAEREHPRDVQLLTRARVRERAFIARINARRCKHASDDPSHRDAHCVKARVARCIRLAQVPLYCSARIARCCSKRAAMRVTHAHDVVASSRCSQRIAHCAR